MRTRWRDRHGNALYEGDEVLIDKGWLKTYAMVAFVPHCGRHMLQVTSQGRNGKRIALVHKDMTVYQPMESCGKPLIGRSLREVTLLERGGTAGK